jgi:hypothetical protein
MGMLNFLFREVTPKSWNKYIIVYSGAVIGGVVFAMSGGSWTAAITYDLLTVLATWSILKLMHAI